MDSLLSGALSSHVEELSIESLVVEERLRPLSEPTVSALAESMRALGLLHPITVSQPSGEIVARVLAGVHRLEAAKRLGWASIPCRTFDSGDPDQAALTEIDENLVRADLSPAARALHVARRKEIHERLNPETKQGAVGRGGKKDANLASFAADTAAKTQRSQRDIQRDATRAKAIPQIVQLIGTSLDKYRQKR